MSIHSVLVTGANRGIGLEFVKQFSSGFVTAKHIFALCRNVEKAKELKELASKDSTIKIIQLDMKDYERYPLVVDAIQKEVGDNGLNLLINNAGVYLQRGGIDGVTRDTLADTFEVNTIAPLLFTKALLPLIRMASKANGDKPMGISRAAIINVSSLMGSLADNGSGQHYEYRASKAALNMISKSLAVDLKPEGILVMPVHPGWVKTEMGSEKAPTSTRDSVAGLLTLLSKAGEEHHGNFFNFRLENLPW